jgi:membrane associated rhomboid family serine protease
MANQVIEDIKFKLRSGNPITRLIILNVVVFLFLSLLRILLFVSGKSLLMYEINDFFVSNLTLPLSFSGLISRPWTLITYMFTHIDLMHIFWNMITLFWFAKILSDFTSSNKIIPLYLLGGIIGALLTICLIEFVPMFHLLKNVPLLGASAGVTAIIIASAVLVPNFQINLLFVGGVKLIYVALFVLFLDILNVASYSNIGGNLAHLGGALMGFIFIQQYKNGNDLAKPFNRFFDWIKNRANTNRAKMKVAYKRTNKDEEFNYQKKVTQEKVDEILDKISQSGYESLTKEEKDILFKASNKY